MALSSRSTPTRVVPAAAPAAAASADGGARQRIEAIDHLRVYAALTVLFGHSVHVMSESHVTHASAPFYRQGVGAVVFMAMAAFVACYSQRDRFGLPGAGRQYLVKQLTRIVPLYWLFSTLFVLVALWLPDRVDHGELGFGHVLGSYLFVPLPRPFDGRLRPILNPGWVLNYIVWFYVLFAACLACRRRAGLTLCTAVLLGLYGLGLVFSFAGAASFFTDRYLLVLALGMACWRIHELLRDRVSIPIPLSLSARKRRP